MNTQPQTSSIAELCLVCGVLQSATLAELRTLRWAFQYRQWGSRGADERLRGSIVSWRTTIVNGLRTHRVLFTLDVWTLHAVSLSSTLLRRLGGRPKAKYQTRHWALRQPKPFAKSYPSSVTRRNEMSKVDNDAELRQAQEPFGPLWVGRLVKGAIATERSLRALVKVS